MGLGLGSWAIIGCVAFACGGSNSNNIDNSDGSDGNRPGTDGGFSNPDACTGSDCPDVTPPTLCDGSDCVDACAGVSSTTQLTPVNLVVMLDRSGTMGDTSENPTYLPANRWIPVTTALESFFADPGSAGMSAALTFFPNTANSCNASDYYDNKAEVPLTALPVNDTTFTSKINANLPKNADTPTLAAVQGAIQQAQKINTDDPTGKAVIVLVTDGEPYCCTFPPAANLGCINGATPANGYTDVNAPQRLIDSANAIAAVKATIPTYVIGVSDVPADIANLNDLATAGGTNAIFVTAAAGSADATKTALLNALDSIRHNVVSCDFTIPTPSDGRTIDVNKINVKYTPTGQAAQTPAYSADCSDTSGWHFDNPAAPTKVSLCSAACDKVRSTAGAKVDVVFECIDQRQIVK